MHATVSLMVTDGLTTMRVIDIAAIPTFPSPCSDAGAPSVYALLGA